mgnify:FL=1
MDNLTISLHMTPDIQGEIQKNVGLLAFVREAFPVIDSTEVANYASAQRKECLAAAVTLTARMEKYTAKAEEIIAQAKSDFKPGIDNATAAADYCGTLLLDWDTKEKIRVAAERRAQEETERKIRAEAEAKAAQIRARAEEQAREAARKAQEAAEVVRKAQAEGNAKEAAKAAAAAAKQAAEAESRAEADRIKAAQAEAEAAARIAAMPVAAVEKVKGYSTTKNWKAEIALPTPDESVLAIIRGMFGISAETQPVRPEYLAYLCLDMSALHAQAKTSEKLFNVPGMRSVNKAFARSTK